MKKITSLILFTLVGGILLAQQTGIPLRIPTSEFKAYRPINPVRQLDRGRVKATSSITSPNPFGTVTSDVVTAVKIGESSNVYTKINSETNQLDVIDAYGTNGGVVGFIYRQNIERCGGDPDDNGRYRYSISTDGGITWRLGAAGTNTVGNPVPPTGCYGIGDLTPTYIRRTRFPNMSFFQTPGTRDSSGMSLIFTGTALSPGLIDGYAGWQRPLYGKADDVLNPSGFTIAQEDYPFLGRPTHIIGSLVERVPGEFWATTRNSNGLSAGNEIILFKGIYNSSTGVVDWTTNSITADWSLSFDGNANFTTPQIAFSPDGSVGYLACLGDLEGGVDSVFNVVVWESDNGGLSWGAPEEITMSQFPDLLDTLDIFVQPDPNNLGQTLPLSIGSLTCAFELSMTVDINDNAHILTSVHHAGFNDLDDPANRLPGYAIQSAAGQVVVDITKDSLGDWSGVVLANQNTFRGEAGTTARDDAGRVIFDLFVQAARTEDGSKVFFLWTESDTTGTGQDPANDNPELKGAGWDLTTNRLTTDINFTDSDLTWGGRVLFPQASPTVITNGDIITVPTVISEFVGIDAVDPADHWYFSDVNFDLSKDFSKEPSFFYNCRQNPISISVADVSPNCGSNDGQLTVTGAGGLGQLSYDWNAAANNASGPSVSNLTAGIYEVTVTDSVGCDATEAITLNNASSPLIAVDSVVGIDCFQANNGKVFVDVTGGTAPLSYVWSNGESTANAVGLPPGRNLLVVTDSLGCESFVEVSISEPSELSVETNAIDVSCNGETNGEASVTAFGGTGALSILWSNDSITNTIENLAPGEYVVTVSDENGCADTQIAMVEEPSPINPGVETFLNAGTGGPPPERAIEGRIRFSTTGGTPPFSYVVARIDTILNSGGQVILDTLEATPGSENTFENLVACKYIASVIDSNGCQKDTIVVVEAFDPPTLPPAARCEGITTRIDGAIDYASFSVFPNPTNGTVTLSMKLHRDEALTVEIFSTTGQLIFRQAYAPNRALLQTFDLSEKGEGIYLMRVATPTGTETRRVFVN